MEKLVDLFTHHAVLPEFWMWVIFGVAVLVLLLWDLLFFNRKNEVPNFMHTLVVCIVYILAACVFGVFVMYEEGFDKGMLFFYRFSGGKEFVSGQCFHYVADFYHAGSAADVSAPGVVLGYSGRDCDACGADFGR